MSSPWWALELVQVHKKLEIELERTRTRPMRDMRGGGTYPHQQGGVVQGRRWQLDTWPLSAMQCNASYVRRRRGAGAVLVKIVVGRRVHQKSGDVRAEGEGPSWTPVGWTSSTGQENDEGRVATLQAKTNV